MGRGMDSKDLEAAATFYPCMQAADIFQLQLDVACAGMDQRKAHVLARDVAEKLGWHKPTMLHTHLLMGLVGSGRMDSTQYDENPELSSKISLKMSKSIPESSIIIHDEPEVIRSKLRNAYCPPKESKDNPIIDMARQILLPWTGAIEINRPQKYGGPLRFTRHRRIGNAIPRRQGSSTRLEEYCRRTTDHDPRTSSRRIPKTTRVIAQDGTIADHKVAVEDARSP